MAGFADSAVAIGTAITGVAIVALIVSKQSQTPAIIQNVGSAFSNSLGVAVSPVTGSNIAPSGAYALSGSGSILGSYGLG